MKTAEKHTTTKQKKLENVLPIGNITKKKSNDPKLMDSGSVVPVTVCSAYAPSGG